MQRTASALVTRVRVTPCHLTSGTATACSVPSRGAPPGFTRRRAVPLTEWPRYTRHPAPGSRRARRRAVPRPGRPRRSAPIPQRAARVLTTPRRPTPADVSVEFGNSSVGRRSSPHNAAPSHSQDGELDSRFAGRRPCSRHVAARSPFCPRGGLYLPRTLGKSEFLTF